MASSSWGRVPKQWTDDVMTAVGDRFERRLTEAASELRVDVIREIHAGLVVAVLWRTIEH